VSVRVGRGARRWKAISLCIGCACAGTAVGATTLLIRHQLAYVRDLAVQFDDRHLGSSAVRGVEHLKYEVPNIIVDSLRKNGLRYEEKSPLLLRILVEYSYDPAASTRVAVSTRLELIEDVKLSRKLPKGWDSRLWGITWSKSFVDIIPVSQFRSTVRARSQAAVDDFLREVKTAADFARSADQEERRRAVAPGPTRFGVAVQLDADSLCATGLADAQDDAKVFLIDPIDPSAPRSKLTGYLRPSASAECAGLNSYLLSPPYRAIEAGLSGIQAGRIFIVVGGSVVANWRPGNLQIQVPTVPETLNPRGCASADGRHLSLWAGAGASAKRIWNDFVYLGSGQEPTCQDTDYAVDTPSP
jgi:hypothetical protein